MRRVKSIYINSLINATNGVLRVHEEMQVRSAGAKAHAMLCQGFKGSPKFYAGRRPVYEPGQSGHLRTPSSCSRSIHASPAFKRHQDIRAVCLHLYKSPSDKAAEINKVPDRGHLLLHVHSVTCRLGSGLVWSVIPRFRLAAPTRLLAAPGPFSRPLLQALQALQPITAPPLATGRRLLPWSPEPEFCRPRRQNLGLRNIGPPATNSSDPSPDDRPLRSSSALRLR